MKVKDKRVTVHHLGGSYRSYLEPIVIASTPTTPAWPFQGWRIQLEDSRFGFAWYTEPCVFVDQISVPLGTVEVANALLDAIDHVLSREQEAIERHGGLLVIHDWRQMTGYDSAARVAYIARMKQRRAGYLRHVVSVLPHRPLIRMAVQTANIVMAVRSGGSLSIVTDPQEALREHQVRAPVAQVWP